MKFYWFVTAIQWCHSNCLFSISSFHFGFFSDQPNALVAPPRPPAAPPLPPVADDNGLPMPPKFVSDGSILERQQLTKKKSQRTLTKKNLSYACLTRTQS